MKWISAYLLGYVLVAAGVGLALREWGILRNRGLFWTTVTK